MATLAAARAAKESLKQHLHGQPWLRGIGITSAPSGGYAVRVNIAGPRDRAQAFVDCPVVPRSWHGVPIVFEVVGEIRALTGTPLTTQDYGNLVFGGMVMVGTFVVGKIIVGSIIESRRERFEAKGQPPAAVQAKETTMDGLLKMAVMAFSVYQLQRQLPEVLGEVKKVLE